MEIAIYKNNFDNVQLNMDCIEYYSVARNKLFDINNILCVISDTFSLISVFDFDSFSAENFGNFK